MEPSGGEVIAAYLLAATPATSHHSVAQLRALLGGATIIPHPATEHKTGGVGTWYTEGMEQPHGTPRLLDLFCGAGGAAMGYHRAGFEVVGVDIKPQPRYPFEFHQADALEYPLDGFDVIHASPPCQRFTALKTAWNSRAHPDLLTPTRQRLLGKLYVIENVPGAPLHSPIKLCGTMFGLGVNVYDGWLDLWRHRLFEASVDLGQPECHHNGPTIGIYGDHARDRRRKPGVRDRGIDFPGSDKLALGRAAMGMPWATHWADLSQAIPPAYTEYIGRQLFRNVVY